MPGLPEIIEGRLLSDGGWKDRPGAHVLNVYQPPQLAHGDPTQATPVDRAREALYPDEAEDIINWMPTACSSRREDQPCVGLGGGQGIGKDWLLHALRSAVGEWNFHKSRRPSCWRETTRL